jgi:hypothetical protein
MPKVSGTTENLQWVFYDSLTLGASDTDAILFQTPKGSSSKTLEDTNMKSAGKLPSSQEFVIHAISVHTQPDITKALLVALLKDASFELVVGDKRYLEAPLGKLVAGWGIEGLTTGTSIELYHNGNGDPRAIFTLAKPVTIVAEQDFSVECHWKVAPGAVKFWVNLEGILSRSAQ